MVRTTLRPRRPERRAHHERTLDERSLRLALHQPRRHVARPNRDVQRRRGCLADGNTNAAHGRSGVRVGGVSQTRGGRQRRSAPTTILAQRRRDRLGNHRQRLQRGGHVLGERHAIGVLQAPSVVTVYDDGYGISVPNQFQMVKENIYAILQGFQRDARPIPSTGRRNCPWPRASNLGNNSQPK